MSSHLLQIIATQGNSIQTYISLGQVIDSSEGIYLYWPQHSKASSKIWKKRIEMSGLIAQAYLFASLAIDDSYDLLSQSMRMFVSENKNKLLEFANKYFDDFQQGLLIKQDSIFIDLLFGFYNSSNEVSDIDYIDESGYYYNKYFNNGVVLSVKDHVLDWDSISDNVFIESEKYDVFTNDLQLLINLFK